MLETLELEEDGTQCDWSQTWSVESSVLSRRRVTSADSLDVFTMVFFSFVPFTSIGTNERMMAISRGRGTLCAMYDTTCAPSCFTSFESCFMVCKQSL